MKTPPGAHRLALVLPFLLALARCDDPSGPESTATTTVEIGSTTHDSGADSDTGGAAEACLDDYAGNGERARAFGLAFDTTETSIVVLGDGVVEGATERGADRLAVCSTEPSDFFAFEARCPGRLSVELRALEGTMPDLVLRDDAGTIVEEIDGVWSRFFLKPLQRRIDAGEHVLEVRHAGEHAARYSLRAMSLPDGSCQ